MKNKANQILQENLFWIVPLNLMLVALGVYSGVSQRSKLQQQSEEIVRSQDSIKFESRVYRHQAEQRAASLKEKLDKINR